MILPDRWKFKDRILEDFKKAVLAIINGNLDSKNAPTLWSGNLPYLGTANYLVGMNAAGLSWEYKRLLAGANVSVVQAANLITVAVTGITSSQWITTGSNIYYLAGNVAIGKAGPSAGYALDIVGNTRSTSTVGVGVYGNDTSSGVGVQGESVSGLGIYGKSSGAGVGFYGESASGTGLYCISTTGLACHLDTSPTSINSIVEVLRIDRGRSGAGTPASGIGASINFRLVNAGGTIKPAGSIASILTNAGVGTEASAITFWTGTGGAATIEQVRIDGVGNTTIQGTVASAGFLVGATPGIDATIPIAPVAPATVAGSAVFTKGILTAYTPPS